MLDFILGYIQSRMSAQRRISKHPSSAGCAGHTLSAKHACLVFYSAVGSSKMLHKLQNPFCEILFFGLLAAARPFSDCRIAQARPPPRGDRRPEGGGKREAKNIGARNGMVL